jgi:hypothetical protein
MAEHAQRHVTWLDDPPGDPLATTDTAGKLANWRAVTVADELGARSWPADPAAPLSGMWWSIPLHLPATTRNLPSLGATKLALVEDSLGWSQARVSAVTPRDGCRIYEITGAGAWAALVARYPLDVSRSRRHDWWRATGETGSWAIPDWEAVARDFDGVHLTVWAYLTTAGRAISGGEFRTVLAGWDPDETYWLTDVLRDDRYSTDWVAKGDGGWWPLG